MIGNNKSQSKKWLFGVAADVGAEKGSTICENVKYINVQLEVAGDHESVIKFVDKTNTNFSFGSYIPRTETTNLMEWMWKNWGVGEEPTDAGEWEFTTNGEGTTAKIQFLTKSNTAIVFLENVSGQYPELEFKQLYGDDTVNLLGTDTVVDGEIIDSEEVAPDSKYGRELLSILGIENDDAY